MNDLLMHDAIDTLDTGMDRRPDVPGLISAARRRRRRTRAMCTACGLATAMVVAPLALLVGTGSTPLTPDGPRPASSTTLPSSEGPGKYARKYRALVLAAVLETFPSANADLQFVDRGLWAQTFTLSKRTQVAIYSSTSGRVAHLTVVDCQGTNEQVKVHDCTKSEVDGRSVRVATGTWDLTGKRERFVNVLVQAPDDGPSLAVVGSSRTKMRLPSVDSLTALALDDRLVPQRDPVS